MAEIKIRNPVVVAVLPLITFGIYNIYWFVKTKEEINSLGGDIPTAWLLIIPIVNIYWIYKYGEAFSKYVKRDNNVALWVILLLFTGPVGIILVQMALNELAQNQIHQYNSQPVQQPIQ